MWTHLAIFFADRGVEAVLKSHVIKSQSLMGWLYWRFAAMTVENRGHGHRHLANAGEFNRRYLTRQISAILYAIGENRNRCTGHTWRFSPVASIGVQNRHVCR